MMLDPDMSRRFVEEIDFREIKLQGVVGKGSFGTVRKGKWKDLDVAVKMIETEKERKAFIVEVQQLSRVDHPNIVKLYGACTKAPVCLVMEYAEGGSLYNVLHCMKQVEYTAAHAISWLLQCARGVAYLHNMKPRALIHRDLKPPNLLLVMGGTVLKICDFGTACDKHTNMTNSKGSAAWMAPEVFEGSQYNEKCDIFSWAIILWEVLTRKKPFYDVGATAFCIMWAVHNGTRPPLIIGCPKPLEMLMTRCWTKDPLSRPSMSEVVQKLEELFKFVKGYDEPITFAAEEVSSSPDEFSTRSSISPNPTGSSNSKTVLPIEFFNQAGNSTFLFSSSNQDRLFNSGASSGLSYSRDDIKRRSADFSKIELKLPSTLGHRRSGSCDSPHVNVSCDQNVKEAKDFVPSPVDFIDRKLTPGACSQEQEEERMQFENAYLLLEPKLQPLQPAPDYPESLQIFEDHRKAAKEFLHFKDEVSSLTKKKNNLQKQLQDCHNTSTYADEYLLLKKEKENLLLLRENLKLQLKMIKGQHPPRQQNANHNNQSSDEWVML